MWFKNQEYLNNNMKKSLITILSVSLLSMTLFSCSEGSKINYKDIYNGAITEGTLRVEKYQDMESFINKIGFRYAGVVTIKDYYYYLDIKSATPSNIADGIEEDAGVDWSEDYNIIARYAENPPYQYYYGSYQGQPVVYKWDPRKTYINIKDQNTKFYTIKGKLSKNTIRLKFTGLYENGMADNYITQNALYLPCILIEVEEMTD